MISTIARLSRCIRRRFTDNVLWICWFNNTSINGMEHDLEHRATTANWSALTSIPGSQQSESRPQGVYIGGGRHGSLWAGAQRSVLVLGPPRSGKTSSLVIPNVLAADGPVVSTSTKPDVMEATAAWRNRGGWTFLYDPSGEIPCPAGVERVGWSPLSTAASWDAALQTAEAMVHSSRLGPLPSEAHWSERAGALLAPLLHAAATAQLPMRTVLQWVDRHDGAGALEILSSEPGAASDLLAGIVSTDGREQSGIWSTASGILAAYRTAGALSSTELPPLDLDQFCRGPNTMYICSPGRRQQQFAPLVVAAIGDIRDATYTSQRADALHPPMLLALDEVANIAPIPDLPAMVSEGAGQGLLVLACLQDLSQARARWGSQASGFLSLFGTTVVLPGIADTTTLRDLSALAGDHEVTTTSLNRTVGRYGRIRPSVSVGVVRLPQHPVDALAHGNPGEALVVRPDKTMASVTLTPAHACPPWRDMVSLERWPERDPLSRGR